MVYGVRPGATLLLNPQVQPPAQAVFDPVTRRAVRYVETIVPTLQDGNTTDGTAYIPADRYYVPVGVSSVGAWWTSSGGTRTFSQWDSTEKQFYASIDYVGTDASCYATLPMFWPTGPVQAATTHTPKNATATLVKFRFKGRFVNLCSVNTNPPAGIGISNRSTAGAPFGTGDSFIRVSTAGPAGSPLWNLGSSDQTTASYSNGSAADSSWHEFMITFDGTTILFYIDGTLEITKTTNVPIQPMRPWIYSTVTSYNTDHDIIDWDVTWT